MALSIRNRITSFLSACLLTMVLPLNSLAEMLQVSADGTVYLSSDSIEVDRKEKDTYVRGMLYNKESGRMEAAPFVASCAPSNAYVQFRKADGTLGAKNPWSSTGIGAIDAIAITACSFAKKPAGKR